MAGLHSLFDSLAFVTSAVWLSNDHACIGEVVREEHCAH